jgi:RNA polymerase sigma-70 factor (ECF subfamily)
MPDEPDAETLSRFVQGDQAAFEHLFRQFETEVFGWIRRIVRDRSAAEDVLVEAFWRAYRGRARFDVGRSFGAWMRRIATNASLDHLRSSARRRGSGRDIENMPAPADLGLETKEAIILAFRRLPPDLQVVAALALVEDTPYSKIADALGIPIGTVKSRVFCATRLLRADFDRLGVRRC